MAVYVNTNVSSLSGQRYLNNATNSLTTTYQRLSSGLRINSAKDDAAGLQISDRLTSQINGLNQGNRNANDGIAFAQTAEGALDEVSSMLQKVRTLAVQANNGTNTAEDREAIATEMGSLLTEIHRISNDTTYGGSSILAGNTSDSLYGNAVNAGTTANAAGQMTLQVGANQDDTISFSVENYNFDKIFERANANNTYNDMLGTGTGNATDDSKLLYLNDDGTVTVNLNSAAAGDASSLISMMDDMIADVDSSRASLGAIQNRLESSITNQSNIATNESDARSRIQDADFAEESANLTQQSIIQQAATSMLTQANSRSQLALSLLG